MPRRILAATVAVLLAAFGAVVLISYVQGADERARAGEDLVAVLVVDSDVPAGASVAQVRDAVSEREVPARLAAPGSLTLTDLADVAGQVTTAALLPGEQLLAARFADPASFLAPGAVARPDGTVEVSVTLDAQRSVGGVLEAGDKVGIHLTNVYETPEISSTYRVLPDVTVTRVLTTGDADDPAAVYLVTVAVPPGDAPDVVRGTETQSVWLSLERSGPVPADGSPSPVATTTPLGDDQ